HRSPLLHNAARRRGGGFAARGACAAVGNAGDRVPRHLVACRPNASCDGIPARRSRNRVRRRSERGDRVSLGAGPGRPTARPLVRRQVTVIAAHDTPSSIVAKAATTTIPIVFVSGGDPVKLGLVAGLNRPGGNVTGVTFVISELGAKQLGLLHSLKPGPVAVGLLA